jgi:hypothetical protein
VAYSQVSDMLTGDIPLASGSDASRYVEDATDEIDSRIGHIYSTPLDLTEPSPVSRPARLLIKRVANFLATGRFLMAVNATNQRLEVNAYAERLIREASEALDMIASGAIILDGAPTEDGGELAASVPLINNLDAESNVEAFYDRIAMDPSPVGVYVHPDRALDW